MQTSSMIKADPGGFVGHATVHPDIVDEAAARSIWQPLDEPRVDATTPLKGIAVATRS